MFCFAWTEVTNYFKEKYLSLRIRSWFHEALTIISSLVKNYKNAPISTAMSVCPFLCM
jgi:hypothetical protein